MHRPTLSRAVAKALSMKGLVLSGGYGSRPHPPAFMGPNQLTPMANSGWAHIARDNSNLDWFVSRVSLETVEIRADISSDEKSLFNPCMEHHWVAMFWTDTSLLDCVPGFNPGQELRNPFCMFRVVIRGY